MADKRNATGSWSGYSHQGKVGIFVALKKINELIKVNSNEDLSKWSIEWESAEDFDVKNMTMIDSRHQVKAKNTATTLYAYSDVLIKTKYDTAGNWTQGFEIKGTNRTNRYLHTIKEIKGFGLTKKLFEVLKKDKTNTDINGKSVFVDNPNNIQLYEYPNGEKYCSLERDNDLVKFFSTNEIKKILQKINHYEKDNVDRKEGILDHILAELDDEIRKKHTQNPVGFPALSFALLYKLVVRNERYIKQNVHSLREAFHETWSEFKNEEIKIGVEEDCIKTTEEIVTKIYEYNNTEFCYFLININPNENINESWDSTSAILNLYKKENIQEVFFKCLLEVKEEEFNLTDFSYFKESGYTLTAVNRPNSRVRFVIENMMQNQNLSKAIFDKDFLINGRIDNVKIGEYSTNDNWKGKLKISNKFISPNMEFITVDEAINKLNN